MRRKYRNLLSPTLVLVALFAGPNVSTRAVELGQVDDFDTSALDWRNGNAAAIVLETDGPDGFGDGYMLVASGDFPLVPRLVIFNEAQWAGDYQSAGITSISAYIRNESMADQPLEMRVALGNALGGPLSGGTWFVSAESITLPAPPPLRGDYSGNRIVDAADYNVWRDTFGDEGPDLPADGNGDLVVNSPDYNLWRDNFGNVAVPGPWTLVEFPLGEADLVRTDGLGSYDEVMSNVLTLRLLHHPEPTALGDQTFATFGADLITAHGADGEFTTPEPSTIGLVLLAILSCLASRKF